jgi:lipoprotein signal peptidase
LYTESRIKEEIFMVRIATVLILVTLIFAGAYALVTVALPEVIEGLTFQAVTGESIKDISNQDFRRAYRIISRHEGLFALTSVIPAFFILFAGFRKYKRWAWWAILVTGLIAWGYGIGDSFLHGGYVNFSLHIFGILFLIAGLFLPIKAFFPKAGKR